MKIAQRLEHLPTYVFADLGRRLRALQERGIDVIRLDMGNPDLAPAPEVIEALNAAAQRPDTHGYAGFYGLAAYRRAVADFYERRFGVSLDPESEVLALIGSKEGLYHVATAFIEPGSVALAPDPGYPIYTSPTLLAGGETYGLPLLREHAFLPDLDKIPEPVLARSRVLWLNYPNNPTSAMADVSFLERAVAFAHQHRLLLAYDNPYSEVVWDGTRPPSILEVPGAREVAIEFNSLSKMLNMAGWRAGMVVGNARAIAALARIKTNMDSGIFRPIQEAAVVGLHLPQAWLNTRNEIYRRRRDVVTQGLERMNLWYAPYAATLYVWAEIPPRFESSAAFTHALLEDTGVSIAPGSAFGRSGEGYVRISLIQSEERLEEALERWERWLIGQAVGKNWL